MPLGIGLRPGPGVARAARPGDVVLHLGPLTDADAEALVDQAAQRVAVVTDAGPVRTALGVTGAVDRASLVAEAQALAAQPLLRERHVHRTWRAVRATRDSAVPSVSVVVPTIRPHRLPDVLAFVGAQHHPARELVLLTHGFTPDAEALRRLQDAHGVEQLVLRPVERSLTLGACLNVGVEAASGDYVAKLDDDNHYAPHYLGDLLTHARQTGAQVVGKGAHHVHLQSSGATLLRFPDRELTWTRFVQGGTLLAPREVAAEIAFDDVPRAVDTRFLAAVHRHGGRVWSGDRFNFVSVREASPAVHTWPVSDYALLSRASRLEFFGDPRTHTTV